MLAEDKSSARAFNCLPNFGGSNQRTKVKWLLNICIYIYKQNMLRMTHYNMFFLYSVRYTQAVDVVCIIIKGDCEVHLTLVHVCHICDIIN